MSPLTAIIDDDAKPTRGVKRERVIATRNGAMVIAVMRSTNTTGAGSTEGPSHHGGLPTVRPVMPDAAMPKMTPPHEMSAIERQPRVRRSGALSSETDVFT